MGTISLNEYKYYNEAEITELYKQVGWGNYYNNPKKLKLAYENSLYILGAYIENKLIGVIRIIGDGNFIIYIQDIIVSPSYQGRGVGKLLVKAIIEKYNHVDQMVLLTDNQPETLRFYKSVGFNTPDKFGCISFVNFLK